MVSHVFGRILCLVGSYLRFIDLSDYCFSEQSSIPADNTPTSRDCWGAYDIHSDYSNEWPTTNVVREYNLTASNMWIAPDGVEVLGMVFNSQFPAPTIEPFQSYTYEFQVTQYGVSWYHSHFALQYPAGFYGPLKINGPTSQNYDIDIGPLLISDWFHQSPFSLFYEELCCLRSGSFYSLGVAKGKKYKISLVNAGTSTQFTFWIDGHTFTVVGTDFVPIEGYETDTLNIAVGQRYDIIIKANADCSHGTNFWIHARDSSPDSHDNRLNFGCLEPPAKFLVPVVSKKVGKPINGLTPNQYLNVSLQPYPKLDPDTHLLKWSLKNYPMYLNWSVPSLKLIQDNSDTTGVAFPQDYVPIFLDYPDNDWLYFLIEGMFNTTDPTIEVSNSSHPIHLHGHDFLILAKSHTSFDISTFSPNLDNPPRRDTAMLPQNGYLVIGFEMNNPGAWLLHCRIISSLDHSLTIDAWHASSGMAVQFVESSGQLQSMIRKAGIMPSLEDQCDAWTSWYDDYNVPAEHTQDAESGV
ncbi:multicopper oxidase [Botrytis cinerea]